MGVKRAVIIHCWNGYPNYCWYPQTKKELEEKGFEVKIPEMPESTAPKLTLWLSKLKEIVGESNEELFLIGHSAGAITILRYLEGLEENQRIGGAVLVAGFSSDLGYPELTNFFTTPIDFEKIRSKAKFFVCINSTNDPYVSLKYGEEFKEKLGAKLIIKENFGHFSGPLEDSDSVTSLPEVAESILAGEGD